MKPFLAIPICASLLLLGCVSQIPVNQDLSSVARLELDRILQPHLQKIHESAGPIVSDETTEKYLSRIGWQIKSKFPNMSVSPIQFKLYRPTGAQALRVRSAPGAFIYLPINLFKEIQFEHELYAIIAFEIGNLENLGIAWKIQENLEIPGEELQILKLIEILKQDGAQKIISDAAKEPGYKLSVLAQSATATISSLYFAAMDFRGVDRLWNRYLEAPNQSGYSTEELNFLIQKTREGSVNYTPIRNPTVRSEDFIRALERIRRL